jgi:hypothetical protein
VEDGPDSWATPVSRWERKERGGPAELGRREMVSRRGERAVGKKRKGGGEGRWAAGRQREGERVLFFFNPLLKILFMFSKKTFKPHNQTKAHAFNMMHKHLGIF